MDTGLKPDSVTPPPIPKRDGASEMGDRRDAGRERLKRPVTLAEVKARKDSADPDESGQAFELVRMGRLSVMPVSAEWWNALLAMAK
jgi:predicted RNA-binding protein with PUA-like domain